MDTPYNTWPDSLQFMLAEILPSELTGDTIETPVDSGDAKRRPKGSPSLYRTTSFELHAAQYQVLADFARQNINRPFYGYDPVNKTSTLLTFAAMPVVKEQQHITSGDQTHSKYSITVQLRKLPNVTAD